MHVDYEIQFPDGNKNNFSIPLDRPTYTPENPPAWTKLSHHRCTNCPLVEAQSTCCPAAVDVQEILSTFHAVRSTTQVHAIAKTERRETHALTDAQTAVRSLLGFVMATSHCPILGRFRGLAHFHLPFANNEETMFRSISAYLIQELFKAREKSDGEHSFDKSLKGLVDFYGQVEVVNRCFFDRIKSASQAEANLNALVSLCGVAQLASLSIDDFLDQLKEKFASPA